MSTLSTTPVSRDQRHTRGNPCPVCKGYDEMPRGQGKRCAGFTSEDGMWCNCSRVELAGTIPPKDASGETVYVHMMRGACNCGVEHGARAASSVERIYPYYDEAGELLFEVLRLSGKQFRQRRPDGIGGHEWKLGDTRRILYKLPELLAAAVDEPVFVCEGEKDVETARKLGLVATCNPGGAGKWHIVAELAREVLAGRDVTVFRDADDVGRKHAAAVAKSLAGVVRSIVIVESPVGKDLSDYVDSGADLDAIQSLPNLLVTSAEPTPATPPRELPPNVISIDDARSREERQRDEDRAKIVWAPALDTDDGPIPWTCEALRVGPGRPTVFAGEGGSSKTMFVEHVGLCVATGRPILRRHAVTEGSVLLVDFEQGLRISKRRLRRMARVMGIELATLDKRIGYLYRPFFLDTAKNERRLYDLVAGFRLVIIDSTRRSAPRLRENDAEASLPLEIMANVSERGGPDFIATDHATTKGTEQERDRDRRKAAQRGHSTKLDGSGTLYVLSKEKGLPTLVTCEREQSEGEEPESFCFDIVDVPNPDKEEPHLDGSLEQKREHDEWRKWGLDLKELGPEAARPKKKKDPESDDPVERLNSLEQKALRLLELVKTHPRIGSNKLAELAPKMRKQTFNAALAHLVDTSRIKNATEKATRKQWVAQ